MLGPFFKRVDNSPLVLFRVFFGILLSLECFGAILTGWVQRTLVEPDFTFTFIGFEWLQPLAGPQMFLYYALMGLLGVFIALGFRYRLSIILFTLLWTGSYLLQKTAYNNHYYLLVLLCAFMCVLPAERAFSLDSEEKPSLKSNSMQAWVRWIFIAQLFIVYTYAAIAKMYTDWMDLSFISLLMESKAGYPLIGEFLQRPLAHVGIAWFGLGFDLLIVPLLLWKPSRGIALAASVFFHLFNSLVFQIGIFPYLSLALIVFFYPPESIRRRFFPKRKPFVAAAAPKPKYSGWLLFGLACYFLVQVALPLRHHFIAGEVLWTEEGHRMSWRMMLRSRTGSTQFRIVDKQSGEEQRVNLREYLSPKQIGKVSAYPDFIWQFAQHLKNEYRKRGKDIAVYAESRVRINRRPFAPLIDPTTDLAAQPWDPFRHHPWILHAPFGKGQ